MSDDVPAAEPSWRQSRYGFAGFWFLSLVGAWFLLRLVLLLAFKPPAAPAGELLLALLSGLHRDVFAALLETIPLLMWLWIVPDRWFGARWHRVVFIGACFLFCYAQIFLIFVEFFFFEEFRSRFNTVAVDYLLYPREVFINIWQSYHVGVILLICLALSLGWLFAAGRLFGRMWHRSFSAGSRLLRLAVGIVLTGLLAPTLNLKGADVSNERTLNEVANNGALSFIAAVWTRNLDYAAFYKTMPPEQAYQRARRLLAEPNTQFVEEGQSIRRRVAGDPNRPRLNVVILIEESLGSEFWGCLGRKETLTPEMDKLAAEEGMLFTNIYASGNRTVRGFEGVLSSFPPLPGESIVKRDRSHNVETIARVLKRDGYATVFLYGGRGLFDGMRAFAVRNGYDRFIEQKHFEQPTFSTIWGVCDEDLMLRAVEEFRELAQTGQPFFGTVLSVSNHKPYTYPKGRIPEDPETRRRAHAVKYSDYALGLFFKTARQEAFWTNTVFVVVADHGARVYGEQSIPIHSYEIPLLVAGPAVVKGPSRVAQLGCSLDVPTTILGLLGRPYESLFFGRDLLKSPPEEGRAFLNHNRDIGMLKHDRLVVLGLMHTIEFYQGNPKLAEMKLLPQPADADMELEQDTIAIYQVADDLYMHRRYRLDGEAGAQASSPGTRTATAAR
ncbi:MAG TPA: LTA synthase family protein [Candidatus Paceibacterota bacterium]|nr:LTA synthase family protein [Verrucomicrobiota bacterium]HSA09529.1 LTA synthase family protein [Candidatus Paceibacterota bacterium]